MSKYGLAIVIGILGLAGTASAALSVTGSTTALPWDAATQVIVGSSGTGTFTADSGSVALADLAVVGAYAGGDGTAAVTGLGTTWTMDNGLRVGYNAGTGSLIISDNAVVTSTYYARIADGANSTGTITVNGATLNQTDFYLHVGDDGDGTMIITNGGLVNVTGTGDNAIGRSDNGTGYVKVTGIGSAWTMAGKLEIARYENSTMSIEDNGLVKVGGELSINAYGNAIDDASCYIQMQTGGQLALSDAGGSGNDSITDFLALVGGNDNIRFWDGDSWEGITSGTEGVDYALSAGTGGLAGYAVLKAIPEPATLSLLGIVSVGIFWVRRCFLI